MNTWFCFNPDWNLTGRKMKCFSSFHCLLFLEILWKDTAKNWKCASYGDGVIGEGTVCTVVDGQIEVLILKIIQITCHGTSQRYACCKAFEITWIRESLQCLGALWFNRKDLMDCISTYDSLLNCNKSNLILKGDLSTQLYKFLVWIGNFMFLSENIEKWDIFSSLDEKHYADSKKNKTDIC